MVIICSFDLLLLLKGLVFWVGLGNKEDILLSVFIRVSGLG